MPAAPQQRLNILGGEVDAVSPADMLRFVEHCVAGGGSAVVANHNSHSLYLLRRDARLRAFFADADLIQVDSTPMIGWGKLLGMPLSRRHRSTGNRSGGEYNCTARKCSGC